MHALPATPIYLTEVKDMKIRRKALIISIAIPLAVGALAALITRESMELFGTINKPPLSPPAWVFPTVWSVLYTLMGIASYIVYTSSAPEADKKRALRVYALQLVLNFLWPVLFFGLRLFVPALILLAVLWVMIFITQLRFEEISTAAGRLLLPYLVWVAFAGYLNAGIALLN